MGFQFTPRCIAGTEVAALMFDGTPSIEVTEDDLPIMKEAMRKTLAAMGPRKRLEYIARSFGFRTAAAMHAAFRAATQDTPLVLTVLPGPLDAFRESALAEIAPRLSEADLIRARDAAHGCICMVIIERQVGEFALSSPRMSGHAGEILALPGRKSRHDPALLVPCMADLGHSGARYAGGGEPAWGEMPEGAFVQILDAVLCPPGPEERARMRPGQQPGRSRPEGAAWVETAEVGHNRLRATMVYRNPAGELETYVTFRVETRPVIPEKSFEEGRPARQGQPSVREQIDEIFSPEVRTIEWGFRVCLEEAGHAAVAGEPAPAVDWAPLMTGLKAYVWEILVDLGSRINSDIAGRFVIGLGAECDRSRCDVALLRDLGLAMQEMAGIAAGHFGRPSSGDTEVRVTRS